MSEIGCVLYGGIIMGVTIRLAIDWIKYAIRKLGRWMPVAKYANQADADRRMAEILSAGIADRNHVRVIWKL